MSANLDMDVQIRASLNCALMDVEQKKLDLKRLESHVALYGYCVSTNVPYDGDCFYSSVLHHLNDSPLSHHVNTRPKQATELRRQLLTFVQSKVCMHSFNLAFLHHF